MIMNALCMSRVSRSMRARGAEAKGPGSESERLLSSGSTAVKDKHFHLALSVCTSQRQQVPLSGVPFMTSEMGPRWDVPSDQLDAEHSFSRNDEV